MVKWVKIARQSEIDLKDQTWPSLVKNKFKRK